MIYDFHSHTVLSDGSMTAMELIRRAIVAGYRAIAITDHVGEGSMARVISEIQRDCALANEHWDILAIPGVELTHVPPGTIDGLARKAKRLGASIVVVHGETLSEPVIRGTNLAAVQSPFVDILAHPGMLGPNEAETAARNGIFIEITTRKSHSMGNAQVAAAALKAGALTLVNSDTHDPENLLSPELVRTTLFSAGIQDSIVQATLNQNPARLLESLQGSPK